MHNTNIKFWKRRSLSQYVLEEDGSLTYFTLFLLGVTAAILHQHLRMGLNIPGHHGLEWMTLLLFARMQSRSRWAGMIVAGGAASACLLQAGYMPLAHTFKPALVYLLNGFCLDFLYRFTPGNLPVILKGMVLGGISFVAKPVLLIPVAVLFDVVFGSFSKHGYLYPVLTHFLFGSIGAITGICLANLAEYELRKNRS